MTALSPGRCCRSPGVVIDRNDCRCSPAPVCCRFPSIVNFCTTLCSYLTHENRVTCTVGDILQLRNMSTTEDSGNGGIHRAHTQSALVKCFQVLKMAALSKSRGRTRGRKKIHVWGQTVIQFQLVTRLATIRSCCGSNRLNAIFHTRHFEERTCRVTALR